MRLIKIILSLMCILFSIFVIVGAAVNLYQGSADHPEDVFWGLIIFFSVLSGLSFFYMLRQLKKRKKEKAEKAERKILRIIARKGGRITPFELASETRLTYEESEEFLNRYTELGAAQIQLTPDGNPIYIFQGVMSMYDKVSSKSPLDL